MGCSAQVARRRLTAYISVLSAVLLFLPVTYLAWLLLGRAHAPVACDYWRVRAKWACHKLRAYAYTHARAGGGPQRQNVPVAWVISGSTVERVMYAVAASR